MNEKRVYQRSPIELAASYGIPEDSNYSEKSTVINISGGGFCICSREKLPQGKEIQLAVKLNEHDYVIIDVRVVWAKQVGDTGEYRLGVQIINSTGEDFEKFLDFYCTEVKKISEEL